MQNFFMFGTRVIGVRETLAEDTFVSSYITDEMTSGSGKNMCNWRVGQLLALLEKIPQQNESNILKSDNTPSTTRLSMASHRDVVTRLFLQEQDLKLQRPRHEDSRPRPRPILVLDGLKAPRDQDQETKNQGQQLCTALRHLFACLADVSRRRTLQSAANNQLVPPTFKLSNIGSRAFPSDATRIWNTLPDNVVSVSSSDSFRHQLKTFLFQ